MQRAETRAYTNAKLMLPSYQPGDPSARAPPLQPKLMTQFLSKLVSPWKSPFAVRSCPSPLFIVFPRASNPKKRRKSGRIKPCHAQSAVPATHFDAPVVKAIEKTRPRQTVPNTSVSLSCRDVVVVVFFTLTDRASTKPSNIRGCQSGTWSQRGTKVNGSHHGDNPLLRPTGMQIATKSYATLQAMT